MLPTPTTTSPASNTCLIEAVDTATRRRSADQTARCRGPQAVNALRPHPRARHARAARQSGAGRSTVRTSHRTRRPHDRAVPAAEPCAVAAMRAMRPTCQGAKSLCRVKIPTADTFRADAAAQRCGLRAAQAAQPVPASAGAAHARSPIRPSVVRHTAPARAASLRLRAVPALFSG